jgi:hypothetical protein
MHLLQRVSSATRSRTQGYELPRNEGRLVPELDEARNPDEV